MFNMLTFEYISPGQFLEIYSTHDVERLFGIRLKRCRPSVNYRSASSRGCKSKLVFIIVTFYAVNTLN